MRARPSFEEVFGELPYVCNVLRRLGVSDADREDRAQEVFLAAYQSLPSFDPERPLRPWLHGIAFNVVRNQRALARNQREVLMDGPIDSIYAGSNPEEALAGALERELLIQLMQGLDLDHRAVVSMHIDWIDTANIARELAIAVPTAYKRLATAKEKLRAAATRAKLRDQHVAGSAMAVLPFDLAAFLANGRSIREVPADVQARVSSRVLGEVARRAFLTAGTVQPAPPPDATRFLTRVAARATAGVALLTLGAAAGASGMYAHMQSVRATAPPTPIVLSEVSTSAPLLPSSLVTATAAAAASSVVAAATVAARPTASAQAPGPEEDEETLIRRARMAYARNDAASALEALNMHARRYPRGDLASDRDGLRVQIQERQRRAASPSAAASSGPMPPAIGSSTPHPRFSSDD